MEPLIFSRLRREVPNKRQQEFFRSKARHTAYGGARGGGKSWAMRRKLVMLAIRYPNLRLLLLRRSLQELRENHLLPLQSDLFGYAEYKKDERAFLFPNGSRLVLGYCDSDALGAHRRDSLYGISQRERLLRRGSVHSRYGSRLCSPDSRSAALRETKKIPLNLLKSPCYFRQFGV